MERIELHLHTKMSDCQSLIDVRAAIEKAVELGHRAIAITNLNSALDLIQAQRCCEKIGNGLKVIYGAEVLYEKEDECGDIYSMTLLAKNQKGLKALYRILSTLEQDEDPEYQEEWEYVDWNVLCANREDLLCGAGAGGELYSAIELGLPEKKLQQRAKLYDYLELFPAFSKETIQANKTIYKLGKHLGIPVVAAGNCRFLKKEDEIGIQVLQETDSCISETKRYFHTTEQMLAEFAWLGEDAAYEVVVTNPNQIADRIGEVKPLLEEYPPFILPNAKEELQSRCQRRLEALYGAQPPAEVTDRFRRELSLLREDGASIYLLAAEVADFIKERGEQTGFRGTIGSSFVAYLAGVTDVNPLPAHYRCAQCGYIQFAPHAMSGYDLPDVACPHCGAPMLADGHNIPYESCLGYMGDLKPDIDLNVPDELQESAWQFLRDRLGADRVVFARAVGTITERHAQRYLRSYETYVGKALTPEQIDAVTKLICGVKRADSRFPGGIVILPEGMEFCDVTPVRKLSEPEGGITHITHMEYHDVESALVKMDILPHLSYDRLGILHRLTGTKPEDVDYRDPAVYAMFRGVGSLGIPESCAYDLEKGTWGLPEFSSPFMMRMLDTVEPRCFSDLVRISGMSHGTNVWIDNGDFGLRMGCAQFRDLVGDREDVFLQLQRYGVDSETAYKVMQTVRRGRFGLDSPNNQALCNVLKRAGVPAWYIDSLRRICYLFPKGHAVAYVKMAVALAWFKLYYPAAFYAVHLHWHMDGRLLNYSYEALRQELERLRESNEGNGRDNRQETILLLMECRARGIEFLPPLEEKSDLLDFLPEDGNIRLPLQINR